MDEEFGDARGPAPATGLPGRADHIDYLMVRIDPDKARPLTSGAIAGLFVEAGTARRMIAGALNGR
jgi:hypothetical protein